MGLPINVWKLLMHNFLWLLQSFDAVGWVTGRADNVPLSGDRKGRQDPCLRNVGARCLSCHSTANVRSWSWKCRGFGLNSRTFNIHYYTMYTLLAVYNALSEDITFDMCLSCTLCHIHVLLCHWSRSWYSFTFNFSNHVSIQFLKLTTSHCNCLISWSVLMWQKIFASSANRNISALEPQCSTRTMLLYLQVFRTTIGPRS